jgi:predicted O-methyltransferase YrrM
MFTTLDQIGLSTGTDKSSACHNFLNFYEKEIDRTKINTMVEIGVLGGSSIVMWRNWLPSAEIYAVDINPPLGIPSINEIHADASQPIKELENIEFDLIIDDASHLCSHQQKTFEMLYPKLKSGGYYIMEDLHTSFIPEFQDTEETTWDYLEKRYSSIMKTYSNNTPTCGSRTAIIFKP